MHQYTTVHTIQVQQCTHMNILFSLGREFSLREHRAHTRLPMEGNVIVKSTDQRQTLGLAGTCPSTGCLGTLPPGTLTCHNCQGYRRVRAAKTSQAAHICISGSLAMLCLCFFFSAALRKRQAEKLQQASKCQGSCLNSSSLIY